MKLFRIIIWLLFFLPHSVSLHLGSSFARAQDSVPAAFTVSFIAVGQGDAILVRDGYGFDVLVDGGRPSAGDIVLAYLRQLGVDDLEAILATHADQDHIGGLIDVLTADDIPVESALYNGYPGDTQTWMRFVEAVAAEGLNLIPAQYPQNLSWGGVAAQVLNPLPNLVSPEQNEASVVLLLTIGQVDLILTADIDTQTESELLARGLSLQAEVLKVAHHGSQYSSGLDFLKAVEPEEAIISVGNNSYGHPAPETLQRLTSVGARLWRTDFSGTVVVIGDGFSYSLSPRLNYLPLIR